MHKRMKPDAWMPFDWPKFQSATTGLPREIKWSYFNAICAYFWGDCQGLNNSDDSLRIICECFNPAEWARTKGAIFGPFFKLVDGKWHQKRAKEEYDRAMLTITAASNRGKAGAEARWSKQPEQCSSNAQAMPEQSMTDAPSPSPSPVPVPTHSHSCASAPAAGQNGHALADFEAFWKAYPKKQSRFDAEHAFAEVRAAEHLPAILSAIQSQRKSEQWQADKGRFIPLPATWLRDGRWNDRPVEVRKVGGNL